MLFLIRTISDATDMPIGSELVRHADVDIRQMVIDFLMTIDYAPEEPTEDNKDMGDPAVEVIRNMEIAGTGTGFWCSSILPFLGEDDDSGFLEIRQIDEQKLSKKIGDLVSAYQANPHDLSVINQFIQGISII